MAHVPSHWWVTILLGIGILLVGSLVKYRGWTWLISGVAPFDGGEPLPVYVSHVGNVSLVAGGFVVVAGLAQALGVLSLVPGVVQGVAFLAALVLVAPRLSVRTAT